MATLWELMRNNADYYAAERRLWQQVHAVNPPIVTNNILAGYSRDMADLEMDGHLMFAGQNGSGKSWSASECAKSHQRAGFKRVRNVFRDTSAYTLGYELCTEEENVFMIDELRKYLHAMNWNNKFQRKFTEAIEVSREKRNVMLGCAKEPHKIDKWYRDGKVHTVVMLLDRAKGKPPFGFVLHAYVYLPQEDKFKFEEMQEARGLRDMLEIAEENKMFLGWYFGDKPSFDIKKYSSGKSLSITKLAESLERGIAISREDDEDMIPMCLNDIEQWIKDENISEFKRNRMTGALHEKYSSTAFNESLKHLMRLRKIKRVKKGFYSVL